MLARPSKQGRSKTTPPPPRPAPQPRTPARKDGTGTSAGSDAKAERASLVPSKGRRPGRAPGAKRASPGVVAASPRALTLAGSCQCGKVTFTVTSETPVPFMYCFCSICRKTSGSAYACNIMGVRKTLKVKGSRHLRAYHARIREAGKPTRISEATRWFCGDCGTHLYLTDDRWANGIWPNVAAIDTPLPEAPEQVHLMVDFKPSWLPDRLLAEGRNFAAYPDVSIADWHEQHGWPITVRP